MQYSPKLKRAIGEIKQIMGKYDIAGLVILHTPGFSEYLLKIDTTYSCAKIEGDQLRVKAKLKEDFNGNKAAMEQSLKDTSNMLHHLSETGGRTAMELFNISAALDEKVKAEHTGKGFTSVTTQNN